MSEFIQLHMLVSYPPSNLNRDDLGRPKTAIMGGTQRLRISSQSLKRAWRTSDLFSQQLSGHIGIRTKTLGDQIFNSLSSGIALQSILNDEKTVKPVFPGVSEKVARESAQKIAGCFGKMKSGDDALEIEHLAHINPEEITQIEQLIEKIAKSGKAPSDEELNILTKNRTAVDIAMFGRMLAASPKFNTEAAVQVAHAITVHEIAVEDDYFTAVDDLNRGEEDSGAGHLGETEFAAGLFYLYVCINKDLLIANLGGKEELAKTSLKAFIEAATKIAPTGKQNSFASRAYASYLLAEKGAQQPRSLSVAFLKPVEGKDMLKDAIDALRKCRENIDTVYGKCCASDCEMNTITGQKTLEEILMFVAD